VWKRLCGNTTPTRVGDTAMKRQAVRKSGAASTELSEPISMTEPYTRATSRLRDAALDEKEQ
jgi:hypothetical protein